jgi:hypothetical protein
MKKLFTGISFWFWYTLGFTVALPVIVYYTQGSLEEPPLENDDWAYFYLGLGIFIWLVVIFLCSRYYIKLVWTNKKKLEKTAQEGKVIMTTITNSRQAGTLHDTTVMDLRLAFNNLAGAVVEIPYQLNDSRPHEKRFEVGHTIEMRVNTAGKNAVFVPNSIVVSMEKGTVLAYSLIMLLLLAIAIGYPYFSYLLESNGNGWRFLKIYHPWILVPLINLAVVVFIGWLLGLLVKATGNPAEPLRMILDGIRTTGTIVKYRETGTSINDQPQIQFDIEYLDQQGVKQLANYKKVISLLEIHKLSTGPKEIMYLPTHPQEIVFYEDLIA